METYATTETWVKHACRHKERRGYRRRKEKARRIDGDRASSDTMVASTKAYLNALNDLQGRAQELQTGTWRRKPARLRIGRALRPGPADFLPVVDWFASDGITPLTSDPVRVSL